MPLLALAQQFNQTILHPMGAAAVIVLGIFVLALPRRLAILPILALVCFVPSSQRIVVGGLDLGLLRILTLFGWIRLITRGELRGIRLQSMDKLVTAWAIVEFAVYVTLRKETSAAIFMSGKCFDIFGMYFFLRAVLRTRRDLTQLASMLCIILAASAVAFSLEHRTGRNVFSVFGGVPPITFVREGRMRCQGAFDHPILAGCFFAVITAMAASRIWSPRGKTLGMVGLGCGLLVVVTTGSSTTWGAALAGIVAALVFPLRESMRMIRWGIFLTLCGLHMVMTMPVWHLLSRIDLVGGSTGWHRYNLINQAVERVGDWALLGTTSTAHWGIQLFDVTNQYVLEGVNGGMATLLLYVAQIALCYVYMGRVMRASGKDLEMLTLAWSVGTAMFVHMTSFLGVSYFGQMQVGWYLTLAMSASLHETLQSSPVGVEAAEESTPEQNETVGRGDLRPLPVRPPREPLRRGVLHG